MVFTLNPFREIEKMKRELETIFDSYHPGRMTSMFPAVNVYENSDEVKVVAEIAGAKKDELNIEYSGGVLRLSGKINNAFGELTPLRTERRTGEFEKGISVGEKIDEAKISAKYVNGLLTVTLPKKEEVKPKQIKIDVK